MSEAVSIESAVSIGLKCFMANGVEYDSNKINETMKMCMKACFNGWSIKAEFYAFIEAYRPNGPSCGPKYSLTGQYCNNVGVFCWTPTNGTLSDQFCNNFTVGVKEQDTPNYVGFVDFFYKLGYTGTARFQEQEGSHPYSLKLTVLCRYKFGNDWHWVEASSDAFIYKPTPPKVLRVQPNDVKLYNCYTTDIGNGSNAIEIDLNRPLILGYDNLTAVTLHRDGYPEESVNRFEIINNRLRLDLTAIARSREFWNTGERFFATVRLHGNSGGVNWLPSSSDVTLVLQRVGPTEPPPNFVAPTLRQRRERCGEEFMDQLDDVLF